MYIGTLRKSCFETVKIWDSLENDSMKGGCLSVNIFMVDCKMVIQYQITIQEKMQIFRSMAELTYITHSGHYNIIIHFESYRSLSLTQR